MLIEVDPEAESSETRSAAACGRVLPSCPSPQTPVGLKECLWREQDGEPWSYTRAHLFQHLPASLGSLLSSFPRLQGPSLPIPTSSGSSRKLPMVSLVAGKAHLFFRGPRTWPVQPLDQTLDLCACSPGTPNMLPQAKVAPYPKLTSRVTHPKSSSP